jgi:hypothetical protein
VTFLHDEFGIGLVIICPFVFFLLINVLSVIGVTATDFFGIYKRFLLAKTYQTIHSKHIYGEEYQLQDMVCNSNKMVPMRCIRL